MASATSADHNLLVGALALQLGFVPRQVLMDAARGTVGDEAEPLLETLRRRELLADNECELLAALAARQLARHGNDFAACLASCDPSGEWQRTCSGAGTNGADAPAITLANGAETVAHTPKGPDPHATRCDAPFVTPPPSDAPASDVTVVSSGQAPTEPLGSEARHAAYRAATQPRSLPAAERYRVLRPHQRGGLGQVSFARDQELGREVALKEILPAHADNDEARQRFLLEAEITGSLEHPGVVPVYGLGQYADGRPFYAMRLIRGDNLQLAIDEYHKQENAPDRELRFRQLLGRFVDVCNAIDYAHNRCILHRDLKPGNIMLGKYGETLVVDWGLAKTLGSEIAPRDAVEHPVRPASGSNSTQTRLGRIVGTPAYMSPEQASGRVDMLGPATDIYSLGATLYHLLAGRAPFAADDPDTLLGNVQLGRFDAPRAVKGDVPKALEAICLKAMARQPYDRYATARELADDVERFLADEPVKARPDSIVGRIGRWTRKHRGAVVSAGVGLMAIALSLGLGVVLLNAANQRAERNFELARNAIRDYYVTISEDTLLEQPGMQPLREKLLRQALAYYQEFLAAKQRDDALLDELAQANFFVGRITEAIESPAKAVSYYEQSLAIGDRLLAQAPNDETRLAAQARTLNALGGSLQRLGRLDRSERVYEQAESVRRKLAEQHPDNLEYTRTLANTIMNRGSVNAAGGDPKRGVERWREAQSLRAEQLRSGVADVKLRADAAQGDFNLGLFHLREGDRATAAEHLAAAAVGFQKVREADPEDLDAQYRLALTHRTLGDLHVADEDNESAEERYGQALELLSSLRARNPQVTEYRHTLAATQIAVAELKLAEADLEAALRTVSEAVDSLDELVELDPADGRRQRDLAVALRVRAQIHVELDDVEEAAADARRAVELLDALVAKDAANADYAAQLETAREVESALATPL
jgi:serine/threonine-protein kinase